MKRLISLLLVLTAVGAFAAVLLSTRAKVGTTFPGFLSFENGVVGAYYLPDWAGQSLDVSYHDLAPLAPKAVQSTFTARDYVWIVLAPSVSGLLFFLLGVLVCRYLPDERGRGPLLAFHFLVGLYLIFSPDFHLTYRFVYPHLAAFAFLPAAMLHFSLLYPEESPWLKASRWRPLLPYLGSAVLLVPYAWFFHRNPRVWIAVEYAVVACVSAAYLFWVVRLVATLRRPQFEANRIVARYLVRGQLFAFTVPFVAAVAVFAGRLSFPLSYAAPFTLLFPMALFVGTILARLKQSQMRLVQTEKMATLGNLMAGLAHELKNPLNFVVANLDALKEKAGSPEVREIAQDIEEGAERMRSILEDFRFFSGPDRKEKIPVDLNEVARHAANMLRPRCGERVSLGLLLNEIPRISGDPTALGRAVLNLMANAVEAVGGEGEVSVSTGRRNGKVFLDVRDTGCGISPEDLKRIFDPFFTTKPQGQGTGLGLALTETTVREHGGTIEVRSKPGQGTEMIVEFPALRV